MPRPRALAVAALATAGALLAGCGNAVHDGGRGPGATASGVPAGSSAASPTTPSTTTPTTTTPTAPPPLRGVTVGIDPGHNGLNHTDIGAITRQVWNGREQEDCNTTGTATDDGYPESRFNFAVARFLATELRGLGARVVLTRKDDRGVGPCVDRRARIINRAHADVAIDIHADGGPSSGRGFAVLQPVRSGVNDAVVAPSRRYARLLRDSFVRSGMPVSTYLGDRGLTTRDDLAGLNLTTVPQVLIECGNMRNAEDAALLTSPGFQRRAAHRIAVAMREFLGKA